MAREEWYSYLESTIYNKVSKGVKAVYGASLNTTTVGVDPTDAVFPTLYIHELEPVERGQDLDNISVNAVLCTMQAEAYSHSKSDCTKILRLTTSQFKGLRFNVVAMPLAVQESADVWHGVCRFRRLIGNGDSDIVI